MKRCILLVLAVVSTPSLFAQYQTFVVDTNASEVKISLKTTHELVNGTFGLQAGSIKFNPGASTLSGSIVVLAASGKTGNHSRDKKMYKDILEVEQHATVSFEPKSYVGTLAASGDSSIQVTGVFTLLGSPHEMTVPMQIHLESASATAKTHFVVPYVQWGLKNPSFLFWKAENDVAVDVNLTGTIAK